MNPEVHTLGLAQIRPVRSAEELQALEKAAAADDHTVIAATHLITKGKEIVGYASIGGLVMVNVWMDSQRLKARESCHLINTIENIAANGGARALCVPCAAHSPFYPLMPGLGYSRLGVSSFNVKTL
jgi:Xaa-Pro aminopeptidase